MREIRHWRVSSALNHKGFTNKITWDSVCFSSCKLNQNQLVMQYLLQKYSTRDTMFSTLTHWAITTRCKHRAYTLLTKGCYTFIWGNKIDMDRIIVLPVGCNWHEMYLWLLPNEIRPNLGQTFTSMPSGIVSVKNRSLCGHFPKSAFAPWQVWMNNCIFVSTLTNCSNDDPSNPI